MIAIYLDSECQDVDTGSTDSKSGNDVRLMIIIYAWTNVPDAECTMHN